MNRRVMAVVVIACFMAVSLGMVSVSNDADAADASISVASYDSRDGANGQLVLNASGVTAGNYTATIGGCAFTGTYSPAVGTITLNNYSAVGGALGAGPYPGTVLKKNAGNVSTEVGQFDLSLYEVKFDANGGSGSMDPFIAFGSVSLPNGDGLTSPDGRLFLGWSDNRSDAVAKYTGTIDVRASVTLYAIWGTASTTYTVSVKVNDPSMGSVDRATISDVPYGSPIAVDGDKLTINGTDVTAIPAGKSPEFTYAFDSWSVKTGDKVENDMEVTASFKAVRNTYTVSVEVNDPSMGSVDRATISDVPYGSPIAVDGDKLTINGTDVTAIPAGKSPEFTYAFDSWSVKTGDKVENDMEVTASFKAVRNTYTITWQNFDGTVLEKDVDVPYGAIPSFDGKTPTKDSTGLYEFNGWTPAVGAVTGDAAYTATYKLIVSGDDDDDPIIPNPQPIPSQQSSDDGDSLKVVAVAAACVVVAIIAIFVLAERRN